MTRIILVRHGPVACAAPLAADRRGFAAYCRDYEAASLKTGAKAPERLVEMLRDARLFASSAPRAVQSARLAAPDCDARIEPLFLEEPMLIPPLPGRWPLLLWFAAARGMAPLHPGAESVRRALRERAEHAATRLEQAAGTGSAALIGHGWLNRQIAAALSERGFRSSKAPRAGFVSAHWGFMIYSK